MAAKLKSTAHSHDHIVYKGFSVSALGNTPTTEPPLYIVVFSCTGNSQTLLSACSCQASDISRCLIHNRASAPIDAGPQLTKCDHVQVAAFLLTNTWSIALQSLRLRDIIQDSQSIRPNYVKTTMKIQRWLGRSKVPSTIFLVFTNSDDLVVPATVDVNGRLRCVYCRRSEGQFCQHTNPFKHQTFDIPDRDALSLSRYHISKGIPHWKSISHGKQSTSHTMSA